MAEKQEQQHPHPLHNRDAHPSDYYMLMAKRSSDSKEVIESFVVHLLQYIGDKGLDAKGWGIERKWVMLGLMKWLSLAPKELLTDDHYKGICDSIYKYFWTGEKTVLKFYLYILKDIGCFLWLHGIHLKFSELEILYDYYYTNYVHQKGRVIELLKSKNLRDTGEDSILSNIVKQEVFRDVMWYLVNTPISEGGFAD